MRPGHGSERGAGVTASVDSIGGARYRVTVPGGFKGIILNSASQGEEKHGGVYLYDHHVSVQETGSRQGMVFKSKVTV